VDDRLILMGVIGKPHGVRGQVRVNVFAEDPESLAAYTLTDRKGRQFALEWAHENAAWISEITPKGKRRITDYFTDLIGLQARGDAGEEIGRVANVLDYGAGASLEIMPGGRLIPFTKACVPVVNVSEGFVVVTPPAEVEAREEA
jgi:16S rRNA processing protein RimM